MVLRAGSGFAIGGEIDVLALFGDTYLERRVGEGRGPCLQEVKFLETTQVATYSSSVPYYLELHTYSHIHKIDIAKRRSRRINRSRYTLVIDSMHVFIRAYIHTYLFSCVAELGYLNQFAVLAREIWGFLE